MFEIGGGQQHLGGVMAVLVQRPLVGLDEAALADGGDGLKMGKIGGPARQSEPAHAGPDGPGANQHDLSARRKDVVDLIDELLDPLLVELPVVAGQHAGADLDDDGRGQGGDFLSQEIDHGHPRYRSCVRGEGGGVYGLSEGENRVAWVSAAYRVSEVMENTARVISRCQHAAHVYSGVRILTLHRPTGLSAGRFLAKMASMPVPEQHAAGSPSVSDKGDSPVFAETKIGTAPGQPLVIVLAAAAAGILADRVASIPVAAWWGVAAAGLGLWFVVPNRWRTRAVVGNVLLLVAVAAIAGAWHHCRWTLFPAERLGPLRPSQGRAGLHRGGGGRCTRALPPRTFDPMQGMPSSEGSQCMVDLCSLRNGATWQPISGRATLLVLGKPPAIAAGDRVRCFAKLSAPAVAQNPGESDHAARLRADRVRSCLTAKMPECVSVVEAGSDWNPSRLLHRVRMHGDQELKQYLDPRESELAAAVLLGLREELDYDRRDAFLETGTVHIICIVGPAHRDTGMGAVLAACDDCVFRADGSRGQLPPSSWSMR